MQMLNKEFGGTVQRKDVREDGQYDIEVEQGCPLFTYVLYLKFVLCVKLYINLFILIEH